MNINNAIGQYHLFNLIGINKTTKSDTTKSKRGFNSLQDSVFISKTGKAMSQLDALNKQKENLQERKEELLEASLTGENIEDEIEKLNKKIINIETEIANAKQKEMEKTAKENSKKAFNPELKTKEETMPQKMPNFVSVNLEQMKAAYSTQSRLKGDVRINSEAKTSQGELDETTELESMAVSLNKKMDEELVEIKEQNNKKEDIKHINVDLTI
ncbi:hypothetical protein AN640_04620 [Candidatus Epulonipiscium fishelsonii]|uniref:Uncharacterized protein n=1 Tax=Candidatus Epulonipiscium fishelsonii TaxID=77094 RepID=A0ACC8XIJ6_9FIRM|nr:hypothetical protein AN640_04620 [Epulopiscium sp. SCG-D08WGA-EpuloA1]OON93604.1 MAG: hypothetical protein ATN32_08840 [Epulopiscium sp. AS2M-Bin002]